MAVPIISGNVIAVWRKGSLVRLELYSSGLVIRSVSKPSCVLEELSISTIYGCHRMKGRKADDPAGYFTVYIYHHLSVSKDRPRLAPQRKEFTFKITCSNDSGVFVPSTTCQYDQNMAVAVQWVEEILKLIEVPFPPHWLSPAIADALLLRCKQNAEQPTLSARKYCVFINPNSGPGQALHIFHSKVMSLFSEAGITCKLIITEKANHAHDFVRDMDLQVWDGLIVVSGDGLVYEVINGLMSRPDREIALRCPVGVIPGGSGNGILTTIVHACNEPYKGTDLVLQGALFCARPLYTKIRLYHVETPSRHLISFLSFAWGILADIDIESESYRRLGNLRFTVGGFVRWVGLRIYRGRVSYLPCVPANDANSENPFDRPRNVATFPKPVPMANRVPNSVSECSDVKAFSRSWDPQCGRAFENAELRRTESSFGCNSNANHDHSDADEANEVLEHETNSRPINLRRPTGDGAGSGVSLGVHFSKDNSTANDVSKCPDHSQGVSTAEALCSNDFVRIPRLNEPIPENQGWVSYEGEWVLVSTSCVSHLSPTVFFVPGAKLNEPRLFLSFIRAGASRGQIAKYLLSMDTGEHLNNPCGELVAVHALRVEPYSKEGFITVDGEVIPEGGPIQVSVSNYTATVMARHDADLAAVQNKVSEFAADNLQVH